MFKRFHKKVLSLTLSSQSCLHSNMVFEAV